MYHSFFIHSFTDGYLGCFQHFAIVSCAAMNIGEHRFFWTGVSGFLGYSPSSELPGQRAVPFLVFWGNSRLSSIVAVPDCIPTHSILGFPFSTTSPALVCWYGYDGHSDQCEVVSPCAFNLHLSNGWWCWTSFHMSLGPVYVFLGEVSVQVLCQFLKRFYLFIF